MRVVHKIAVMSEGKGQKHHTEDRQPQKEDKLFELGTHDVGRRVTRKSPLLAAN